MFCLSILIHTRYYVQLLLRWLLTNIQSLQFSRWFPFNELVRARNILLASLGLLRITLTACINLIWKTITKFFQKERKCTSLIKYVLSKTVRRFSKYFQQRNKKENRNNFIDHFKLYDIVIFFLITIPVVILQIFIITIFFLCPIF